MFVTDIITRANDVQLKNEVLDCSVRPFWWLQLPKNFFATFLWKFKPAEIVL